MEIDKIKKAISVSAEMAFSFDINFLKTRRF